MPTLPMQAIQIGFNTADMAGSLRLYREALGFTNAGAQALWGDMIRMPGSGARGTHRSVVDGGQATALQLELFQHSEPKQRPLRADWRASDHGWVRFGVAVANFDECLAVLQTRRRHAADGSGGGARRATRGVSRSLHRLHRGSHGTECRRPTHRVHDQLVADLAATRAFYEDVLELEIAPLDRLHSPADEALWGLAGAEREGFLVPVGETWLEIVCYSKPVGRPRPQDYRIVDQGIMNVPD